MGEVDLLLRWRQQCFLFISPWLSILFSHLAVIICTILFLDLMHFLDYWQALFQKIALSLDSFVRI
jgi:hypothetical protein